MNSLPHLDNSVIYLLLPLLASIILLLVVHAVRIKMRGGRMEFDWEITTVVVIGILIVSIVGPKIGKLRAADQLKSCQGNMTEIATALELYSTDNGGNYPVILTAIAPSYIKDVPRCPSAGEDTYSKSYRPDDKNGGFAIYCSGYNHKEAGLAADYPRYTYRYGLSLAH